MKNKKYIIASAIILCSVVFFFVIMSQNKNDCDTLENRELRLREISNLGELTTISEEIIIDEYIVSGYTTKNNRYGLAIFEPNGDGKYQFQSNTTRENDSLVLEIAIINGVDYNIFWANKPDLDYAEITYTVENKIDETIKIDAQDNQIIYIKSPDKDYNVEYIFVDKNGVRHEGY
ncbi:MAG: hypothetical protein R3Y32_00895 [Bacillota bacterium]